jgi:hypothetical protein
MSEDSENTFESLEFEDPNEELFFAIAWCDRPGVSGDFLGKIRSAHARGADLDGRSDDGETPLTEAILGGTGAPKAVRVLLELGANPSRRAESGWTPWAACLSRIDDRVVSDRMEKIQALLADHDADRADERLLAFQSAVSTGDAERVRDDLEAGIDLEHPIIAPLSIAVENDDAALTKLLLEHGANVEGNQQSEEVETPLVQAALAGSLDMVRLLVEAGADIARTVYGDPECTAEFLARDAGHVAIADWLRGQVQRVPGATPDAPSPPHDPKFAEVYEQRTDGINCGLSTDDIVRVLTDWDTRFGIELSDVAADRLVVRFAKLPADLAPFAREIYEFCPDIVDQGFGCMDDMVATFEAADREIPAEFRPLVEGIDFEDPDFGLTILQRDLVAKRSITLWWD